MKFASTEFYINLFGVIIWTFFTVLLAQEPDDTKIAGFITAVLALDSAWKTFRCRRTPNVVEINEGHLTLFEHGTVKHHIDLKDIVSVSAKLTNTVLNLQNGLSLKVSSSYFMKREDVAAFRQHLEKMVNSAKA